MNKQQDILPYWLPVRSVAFLLVFVAGAMAFGTSLMEISHWWSVVAVVLNILTILLLDHIAGIGGWHGWYVFGRLPMLQQLPLRTSGNDCSDTENTRHHQYRAITHHYHFRGRRTISRLWRESDKKQICSHHHSCVLLRAATLLHPDIVRHPLYPVPVHLVPAADACPVLVLLPQAQPAAHHGRACRDRLGDSNADSSDLFHPRLLRVDVRDVIKYYEL